MQMPYDPYPYSITGDACAGRERQESERARQTDTPTQEGREGAREREREIETVSTLSGAMMYKRWE